MAVVAINVGEMQVRAVVMLPELPVRAAAAEDEVGHRPDRARGLGDRRRARRRRDLLVLPQPPERREKISKVAGQVGTHC